MVLSDLDNIDFWSGLTHREILLKFLERFYDYAGQFGVQRIAKLSDVGDIKEICAKIISRSLPCEFTEIETGSLVECSYIKDGTIMQNRTFTVMRYEIERDLMAVVDVRNLIRPKFETIMSTRNPAYVRILLNCRPTDLIEDDFQSELAFVDGNAVWLSSHLFMETFLYGLQRQKRIHKKKLTAYRWTVFDVMRRGVGVRIIGAPEVPATDVMKETDAHLIFDAVPAIRLPNWPKAARWWMTRHRYWPSNRIVSDIAGEGVLAVCQAPPEDGNEAIDWRLSFSKAETTLLANKELPCRHHAHRIFKYFISIVLPADVLTSYHCKTLVLWASERSPIDSWRWDRLSFCVLGLLDDMIGCLSTKFCSHYFIPEVNLFEKIPLDALRSCSQNLRMVRRMLNPSQRFSEFFPSQKSFALNISKSSILDRFGVDKFLRPMFHRRNSIRNVDHNHFYKYCATEYEQSVAFDGYYIDMCLLVHKYGFTEQQILQIQLTSNIEKNEENNDIIKSSSIDHEKIKKDHESTRRLSFVQQLGFDNQNALPPNKQNVPRFAAKNHLNLPYATDRKPSKESVEGQDYLFNKNIYLFNNLPISTLPETMIIKPCRSGEVSSLPCLPKAHHGQTEDELQYYRQKAKRSSYSNFQ